MFSTVVDDCNIDVVNYFVLPPPPKKIFWKILEIWSDVCETRDSDVLRVAIENSPLAESVGTMFHRVIVYGDHYLI